MLYQLSYSRWWAGKDSNLRRLSQQIYSLPPLATWVPAPKQKFSPCFTQMSGCGAVKISEMLPRAGEGTRTPDLLITNQLLYRLSYASKTSHPVAIIITIHAPIHYSLPFIRNKIKKIILFSEHVSDGQLYRSARPETVQSEQT